MNTQDLQNHSEELCGAITLIVCFIIRAIEKKRDKKKYENKG